MNQIVVIAHNLRSSHNVGSLLRTADGLGVNKVYLTGYTPYPANSNDDRLPHIARKVDSQISKIALGAEKSVDWEHLENVDRVIGDLKSRDFTVVALEQTPDSKPLNECSGDGKIAIVLGREVEGVEPEVLSLCDSCIEIPMYGQKESFNVVQAAAMALYHFRFMV
jgi:tRNA G18 (ribose-2'-O)-methylase SpoU